MGELAPEFKQKIANSDGDNEINNNERTAISYIEKWAWNMPPDRVKKLINAVTTILEQKKYETIDILKECEKALKVLE